MQWGGHKQRAGSRAFWPKGRAKRIYPKLKVWKGKEAKPMGFAAYKAGMLSVSVVTTKKGSPSHGKETTRAVTVLDCPPLIICGVKAYKNTIKGMEDAGTIWAEKVSKDLNRKIRIPKKKPIKTIEDLAKTEDIAEFRLIAHTKPRESGAAKKTPEMFEVPMGGKPEEQIAFAKEKLGTEVKVSDVFTEGDWIDSLSITKGKGFQGPVKRFGIKIQQRKAKKKRRHVGTLGPRTPARVKPNTIAQAGQLGFQARTEWNKRILKMGSDGISPSGGFVNYGVVKGDYLLLDGSIAGPRKRLIMIRPGIRVKGTKEPVQLKEVYLWPQQ